MIITYCYTYIICYAGLKGEEGDRGDEGLQGTDISYTPWEYSPETTINRIPGDPGVKGDSMPDGEPGETGIKGLKVS